jgi:hypothetical protein
MIDFDISWSEFFTIFIACALKPGIAGIPTAVLVFGFNFFETLVVCSLGGITGSFFFSFLIYVVIKLVNKLITKIFPLRNTSKKKFTKVNRFIITMKKKFGVVGVSIIAPLFLSIPLGVFICLKFFGDRPKIIFWMSFFVVFWTIVLYFGLLHFRTLFETLIV